MTYVVNMIPNIFSGETNQDSEPNLAFDPADPSRVAGSAFTPDPLGGTNAPIFVSVDAGRTWALNNVVPSTAGAATGDITLGFGHHGRLYCGILRRPGSLRLNILRSTAFNTPTVMDVLVDRTGAGVDQPYVEAVRVYRGGDIGRDRLYVGNNDFNAASGRTATVDVSLDGAAAAPPSPANFVARRIEPRATNGQDLPPIRPAVHIDGTVYAAYIGRRGAGNSDIVVARDDDGAAGATQFGDLLDSGDGLAGQRVATGVNVPFENFETMGNERLVASDLSIAVDPRDSNNVWVAWGDRPASTTNLTLHLRRSTDRGQNWSADLRTVGNAKAPVVAVNSRGRVAFLYQQVTGTVPSQRWVTQVDRSSDAFSTVTTTVLATVPANTPVPAFLPYLGDYMDMKSPGKDFYGIFSTANTPVLTNFPLGVTYQRNANFDAGTLLDVDEVTPVNASIDPFFFRLTELDADADVYVADWTDGATEFDRGVEPSTEPLFYTRSDVWTRLTDDPGAFDAANRPVNEPPRNGPGVLGDNFAFARVRRRGTGGAQAVSAHFLVSRFGTGSNYADAGTAPDPMVNFAAVDDLAIMANGYPWNLPATSSTHLCLAVEVRTPQDAIVAPSLLGRAPGWPTTDLLVINDNNKAQRNMGLGPTTATGWMTRFAMIHNAATFRRDIVLDWARVGPSKSADRDRVVVAGKRGKATSLRGSGRLVIPGVEPGEHRWVRVSLHASGVVERDALVAFDEMVGVVAVNGFAVAAQLQPEAEVSAYLTERSRSVLTRLAALGVENAQALAQRALELLQGNVPARQFRALASACAELLKGWVPGAMKRAGGGDPLGLLASEKAAIRALQGDDIAVLQSTFGEWLEGADALLTTLDKLDGDTADICQNLRWQAYLLATTKLAKLRGAHVLVTEALDFTERFGARQLTTSDFPRLVARMVDGLQSVAKALKSRALVERADAMDAAGEKAKTLQRRHWEYLLELSRSFQG